MELPGANGHAQMRGRTIEWQGPTALLIDGDAALLAIAFNNLIDNALKYSPASSAVEISLRHNQETTEVRVRDFGPGVASTERELIFERYYRAATALRQPGVGLGLYVVKQLIELHHGKLELADGVGIGACFVITLPLRSREA
mgnify:CR=1 FL=1